MATIFDALLAPLSTFLQNQGAAIDAETGSKKLSFELFVRVLLFGFSIQADSLRRLIAELQSNEAAVVLGLPAFCRSTLKDGFTRFRAGHFEQLYRHLLTQVEGIAVTDKLLQNVGLLKVVDGSIFPLLKSMEWGAFRTKRKALKLHLELCINTLCVTNYVIGTGKSCEREALLSFLEASVTYVCDRGYFSFEVVNLIQDFGAFFVLRLKKNYCTTVIKTLEITGQIPSCFTHITDEIVRFTNNPLKTEAAIFRLVRFRVLKTHFIICTNRTDLTTLQIIVIYAYRWQVELFFKFLKRSINCIHLFSNSQNGAKVYIHLMLCFVLLQINLKQKCHKIRTNSLICPSASTLGIEGTAPDHAIAADWVYEMGLKFNTLFKISINWLTYLKNSIAQIFDYQHLIQFSDL